VYVPATLTVGFCCADVKPPGPVQLKVTFGVVELADIGICRFAQVKVPPLQLTLGGVMFCPTSIDEVVEQPFTVTVTVFVPGAVQFAQAPFDGPESPAPLHAYVAVPGGVRPVTHVVAVRWLHRIVSVVRLNAGGVFTVTVSRDVSAHPPADVIITEYAVVTVGDTVIHGVVSPVLHRKLTGVAPVKAAHN